MMPTPIWNERALFIKKEKAVVIADVHIGIEFEYSQQGVNIGVQTDKLLERCKRLIEETAAEKLVIVGDLKHIILAKDEEQREMMRKERREVRKFLKVLDEYADIWIVKGNHDGRLQSKYAKIFGVKGMQIDDISFAHGHCWAGEEVMNGKIIVLAHIHPFIRITTKIGYSYLQPCWVRGKFQREKFLEKYKNGNHKMKFIIMPAFNPLCGGIAVNREKMEEAMMKIIDIEDAEVYLLNGLNLGRIRNLR